MELCCACGAQSGDAAEGARISQLEAKVSALESTVQSARNPELGFVVQCPAPWRTLGPVGDAVWACRKPQALADGFWPNCNVTEAAIEPSPAPLSAKQPFEASLMSAPELQRARRVSERDSRLGGQPAFEAVYEHDLMQKPLRVLATLAVHDGRAYAVSCAAPPAAFAAHEPMFRSITQSFRFRP